MQRRAALAVLCVFAVALSASLFPAGGFGSPPSGVGTGGSAVPGAAAPGDQPPGGDAPTGTTTDRTATTHDAGGPGDGGTETTTTTTTATTTETTTAIGATGGGRDGSLVVLWGVLGTLGGLALAGFWTDTFGISGRAAGPLPVTVTVRGTPLGDLVGRVPARTMALVVGLSAAVPRLLDDAAGLLRAVGASLSTVAAGLARGAGDALRIAVRGLGATLAAVPHALAGLGAGPGLLSSLGNASLPSVGRGSGGGADDPAGEGDVAAKDGDAGPPTVEEAWQLLVDRVRVRNPDARTPGEFARAAVDRGYPDDAVRRLTDAFREVRYGDLPRSERADAARDALDRLRSHWGDRK